MHEPPDLERIGSQPGVKAHERPLGAGERGRWSVAGVHLLIGRNALDTVLLRQFRYGCRSLTCSHGCPGVCVSPTFCIRAPRSDTARGSDDRVSGTGGWQPGLESGHSVL